MVTFYKFFEFCVSTVQSFLCLIIIIIIIICRCRLCCCFRICILLFALVLIINIEQLSLVLQCKPKNKINDTAVGFIFSDLFCFQC